MEIRSLIWHGVAVWVRPSGSIRSEPVRSVLGAAVDKPTTVDDLFFTRFNHKTRQFMWQLPVAQTPRNEFHPFQKVSCGSHPKSWKC